MDRQEIFTRVKKHLLTQNEHALYKGTCAYRGDDGKKCAIGALIKDEHYRPDLEGGSADRPPVVAALNKSGVEVETTEDENFLRYIQEIHDLWEPYEWPERLELFALNRGLNPNE